MSDDSILLTKPAKWAAKQGDPGCPGVLSVLSLKLTWRPSTAGKAAPITIPFTTITNRQKAQGKPFARIATQGKAYMFIFQSEVDREELFEAIRQQEVAAKAANDLIPPPDLRKAIFKDDESLQEVYQKLVAEGLLSEAEFWAARRDLVAHYRRTATQQAGTLTAMLSEALTADAAGGGKGGGVVSFSLTPEMIRAIFLEKPHVHRTYLANVPHNMDDAQFWTRYLKHTYAVKMKRNRLAEGKSARDIDDEYADMFATGGDPREAQRAAKRVRTVNPAVNLVADAGDGFSEGHGQLHASQREGKLPAKAAPLSAELAAEINRHAEVVLDGTTAAVRAEGAADIAKAVAQLRQGQAGAASSSSSKGGGSGAGGGRGGGGGGGEGVARLEGRVLDDLRGEDAPQYEQLRIQDPARYFDRLGGGEGAATGHEPPGGGRPPGTWQAVLRAVQDLDPGRLPNPPIPPHTALQVVLEQGPRVAASEGGADLDAWGRPTQHPAAVLGEALLSTHLRPITLAAYELLRHLYGTLPISNPQRAARAEKLAVALQQQQQQVEVYIQAADVQRRPYVRQVLRPAAEALEAGLAHFDRELRRWRSAPGTSTAAARRPVAAA